VEPDSYREENDAGRQKIAIKAMKRALQANKQPIEGKRYAPSDYKMFRPERASGELDDAVAKHLANAPSTLSHQGLHCRDMLVTCSQSGENLVSARNNHIAISRYGCLLFEGDIM
jgi:hypothetical protein